MRNCGNCYNGHYNLSERGEEMYCDESEFMEEDVKENDCCIDHRYYPGMEESRYYLFYDASYMGPGYLIASIGDGKVNMIGNIIENMFKTANNYNLGSLLSIFVSIIIIIFIIGHDKSQKGKDGVELW